MPIDQDEFTRWMELLRADMKGISDRLDELNGRTRYAEQKIAVLEDRGHPAVWGGTIGGVLIGIAEGTRWLLGK